MFVLHRGVLDYGLDFKSPLPRFLLHFFVHFTSWSLYKLKNLIHDISLAMMFIDDVISSFLKLSTGADLNQTNLQF